eukprot:357169-Chlamydomonas_euryale.AAC.2
MQQPHRSVAALPHFHTTLSYCVVALIAAPPAGTRARSPTWLPMPAWRTRLTCARGRSQTCATCCCAMRKSAQPKPMLQCL